MVFNNAGRRRRDSMVKGLLIAGALAILVVFGGILFIRRTYDQNLRPVSASQHSQQFKVNTGASVQEIGADLQEAGLVRAAWAFEWYVRNEGVRDYLKAGTYNLRPNMSVPEITDVLTQGRIATDLVTILPGQRLDQIRDALIDRYGFDEAEVRDALNPAHYASHPALVDKPRSASLEGYLYPESFQKTADTNPKTIIRASLDEMQKQLTPGLRAAIVKQGLTVHQGIILASIVEQEVSDAQDRKTVSQVFHRRLGEDIALQSDPTAAYGAIIAGREPSLSDNSRHNTYLHKGLPPTPISNVSISSLKAVANPSGTDYLYFVAGDDGTTYFSHTLAEHEALTRQHCTKLCQ